MSAAFAILMLAASGQKQPTYAQALGVNCAALSGSPYMCIKNQSSSPVIAVTASSGNMFGNDWINIPGGPIMPGGTSIVRFNTWSGGCNQHLFVRTANGQTHMLPFLNVCQAASVIISGW